MTTFNRTRSLARIGQQAFTLVEMMVVVTLLGLV